MMTCPYCGPVEPRPVTYKIKKPQAGTLTIDWCPTCTACLKPAPVDEQSGAKP